MPYALYISAEGAQAQSKRMEVIANNLANVDTAGFKRELAVLQARYAEAIEQGLVTPGAGSIDDVGGGVMTRQTKTDFSPGPLKHTRQRTDVAIEGEGFFLVEKGEETLLTRAGNFLLTPLGGLVTQQGFPVLAEGGAPLAINPEDDTWEITQTGGIRQGGIVQNLAIVKPDALEQLVHVGENLFRSPTEPQAVPARERSVAAGFLEGSGVKPTLEMTALIEASRALEANVSLMKAQDEMLAGLVKRLLRV